MKPTISIRNIEEELSNNYHKEEKKAANTGSHWRR